MRPRRPILTECSAMNVVVCVKQIPDPAAPGALDPSSKTLKREGKLILDESDSYGVEMGLQLAEQAGGGEVTLVSMAPNNETSGLRTLVSERWRAAIACGMPLPCAFGKKRMVRNTESAKPSGVTTSDA